MELSQFNRIKDAIANTASADQILELEEVLRLVVSAKTAEDLDSYLAWQRAMLWQKAGNMLLDRAIQ